MTAVPGRPDGRTKNSTTPVRLHRKADPTGRKSGAGRLAVPLFAVALIFAGAATAQDLANGETVFKKKCTACHLVGPKARNKVGPSLNGVVNRPAGTASGYKFSKIMRESGITWNEKTLASFLRDGKSVAKGSRMKFPGLKNDNDIADVIAYLKQFGSDGSRR